MFFIGVFNKLNGKENVTYISCFDFSTLYIKLRHAKYVKNLNNLTECYFKKKNENFVRLLFQ